MSKKEYFIGLMSGTSIDAIDSVLVSLDDNSIDVVCTHSEPIPFKVRQSIKELCSPGFNAINKMGALDTQLGRLFSDATLNLIGKSTVKKEQVVAIGTHGQTVRHQPNNEFPFSIQIGDPNTIAAHTGLTTIADFRRKDIAHSGQGAPLAPSFHHFLLKDSVDDQWVLNIGGIANVTHIQNGILINGFDTGPGNLLLDAWCEKHTQQLFDHDGSWGKQGTIHIPLLDRLLEHDFFRLPTPKSTGREQFNIEWLNKVIHDHQITASPEDIQATLVELTAQTISDSIQDNQSHPSNIYICGGGAYNSYLMTRLKSLCKSHNIRTTREIGIDPEWVEACAFAWLAQQRIQSKKVVLNLITGATKPAVLGSVYSN